MEVPEWDAQAHGKVHSVGGAEETEIGGGGGDRCHRQGIQSLWTTPGDGDLLQIPGAGDIGDGRRLACGGE